MTHTHKHSDIRAYPGPPHPLVCPCFSEDPSRHSSALSENVLSSQGERLIGQGRWRGVPRGPRAPPAPAPSSHQLMDLAAPEDSLRPSCWQPHPGRDSQPIAFFSLLFTHTLARTHARTHGPMASSALNHSWPALSKFWPKRWAFKRGKGVWGWQAGSSRPRPCRQGSPDSLSTIPAGSLPSARGTDSA